MHTKHSEMFAAQFEIVAIVPFFEDCDARSMLPFRQKNLTKLYCKITAGIPSEELQLSLDISDYGSTRKHVWVAATIERKLLTDDFLYGSVENVIELLHFLISWSLLLLPVRLLQLSLL